MSGRREPRPDPLLGSAELVTVFAGLEGASHILVCVSGGPDSTALLGGLAAWGRASGRPPISAATVDHGLRPEARAEAEAVAAFAGSMGIPHASLTWFGGKGRSVSQEAARRARYRLLVGHAHALGATHLLTAHTLDDQAETLMLRLAAGSGLAGLAGMRREVARGGLAHVRPLLHLPKARLLATCRGRGWPFVEDPSNADRRFARARWRDIMPILAAEGLDAERLGRLARRLGRADEALDQVADDVFRRLARFAGATVQLDIRALAIAPQEIALRVLKRALTKSPSEAEPDGEQRLRLERLEECLDGLLQASAARQAARRTLAGRLLHLDGGGMLTISPEGLRRRGRREPVTPIDDPGRPSLGREPGAA